MTLTFIQTADAYRYAEMAAVTSRTVRLYAQRWGGRYEQYLGVKRGDHPWHAAFNRIFMLEELLDRGVTGWVCHMDADAWIEDLAFDLPAYLAPRDHLAGLFTPSLATDHWWDINTGVFLLNLSHPVARELAALWRKEIDRFWDRIGPLEAFPPAGPDDQSILHDILRERPEFEPAFELCSPDLINSEWAQVIRQHLRSNAIDMDARLGRIKSEVARVLRSQAGVTPPGALGTAFEVIDGLYRGLLGRPFEGDADHAYVQLVVDAGVRDGVRMVSDYISNSGEFVARRSAG